MSHVQLSAVIRKGDRTSKRARETQIRECGGLFHFGSYLPAARQISKLRWCERVVAVLVTEVHLGTWRSGRKS